MRKLGRWHLTLLLLGLVCLAGLGVLLVTVYTLALIPELPKLREVRHPQLELASIAYTADGKELARYYRQNRTWVYYDQIAPSVIQALVATEDHRFYEHNGIDVIRLGGSLWLTARGDRQGGSTITMQLARNLYPAVGRDASIDRKVKEMITAFKIERNYTKREILEMYLNTVPFGFNTFGIEAAAQTYFNKPAARLDVAEGATLVGILKGTTRYNPVRNPDLARQRRNVVLQQMVKHGLLTQVNYTKLAREPILLDFQPPSPTSDVAPHFAEHVRAWAEEWARENGYNLYTDGLRLYTTLDTRLQTLAKEAVAARMPGLQAVAAYEWSRSNNYYLTSETGLYERYLAEGRFEPFSYLWRAYPDLQATYIRGTSRYRAALQQGMPPDAALSRLQNDAAFIDSLRAAHTRLETGLVALDPSTGDVKAWVGGRDFGLDKYDKVALARRQPGSTFKPFVYATAIDKGYSPYYVIQDTVRSYRVSGSSNYWRPTNSGGGASGRYLTLRDALIYSKNTVTAQLMNLLGPYEVAQTARRMGIVTSLAAVPSLGLGTSEVTLLEMASAYGTLAAGGTHYRPIVVRRIEDRDGNLLADFDPEPSQALSRYTAYTVVDMMRGVIDRGTGSRIRWKFGIDADAAGKTGTTQDNADGWFIMMTPRLVAGSWVGFNDRRIRIRSSYWGQGGHNALDVVGDFFRRAFDDPDVFLPKESFSPPAGYRPPERRSYGPAGGRILTASKSDTLGGYPDQGMRDARAEGLQRTAFRPDSLAMRDADAEQTLRMVLKNLGVEKVDSLKRNPVQQGKIGW